MTVAQRDTRVARPHVEILAPLVVDNNGTVALNEPDRFLREDKPAHWAASSTASG